MDSITILKNKIESLRNLWKRETDATNRAIISSRGKALLIALEELETRDKTAAETCELASEIFV